MKKSKKYNYGIKITISIIFLIIFILKKDLLFGNPNIADNYSLIERFKMNKYYLSLKDKSLIINNKSLLIEEKENLLKFVSNYNKKKKIIINNTIYCKCRYKFGNLLYTLNKIIFFNDIVGYNHIILDKNQFWFIKNKIYIKDRNLTIEIYDNITNSSFNLGDLFINACPFFYFFHLIRTDITIHYLRDEIIRNLPKVTTSPEYLYIHIRSGDIYSYNPSPDYSQPPLCFYQKIINNFNFKKIFLLSNGKNNPIIKQLIKEYPNLIYHENSLEVDMSQLINAYNIVASMSSFLNAIILFNHNLKYLWDYNIHKIIQKILHYHFDIFKFPHHNNFTIYRMEPSSYYSEKMYFWKNNKKQRYIIMKETCQNNFTIIKSKN